MIICITDHESLAPTSDRGAGSGGSRPLGVGDDPLSRRSRNVMRPSSRVPSHKSLDRIQL